MADLKKFLDQSGVSTLWTRVAEEVAKVDGKVAGHETRLAAAESAIEALEKGTYDDSEVRGLIEDNADAIAQNVIDIATNTAAIEKLNGNADTVGSVTNTANAAAAAKVAEIVAGADAKFDTLKEIADWILTDTTGAAGMAADIDALEAKMAGVEETVVKSIATAIDEALKVDGANKFALASELSALADRVKAIEDAGYQNAEQVGSAIDAKIAALNLATTYEKAGEAAKAEANAKAYADGLATNYDAAGAAATAEANAKAYTDSEINTKIIALTAAEIDAAINAAKAEAQA